MNGTGNTRRVVGATAIVTLLIALIIAVMLSLRVNAQEKPQSMAGNAASRVYVSPGTYDEFYGFFSGGFNGQVEIYGIPSGRLMQVIPVFSQNAEDGYGFSEETKAMLMTSHGFIPWDDSHHPELSQTNGTPDGRWLFINANNTPRIARLDLQRFRTDEILEIPHVAGLHSAPFITQNSEYLVAGTRFSVPIPERDMPIADYKGNFKGTLNFIKVDPKSGHMNIAFQLLVPGFDYDLAHCGKGPSADWCFFSSYNTEEAHTLLEVNASQFDKDFVAAVNWKRAEQCVAQGKGKQTPADYFHNYVDPNTHVAKSEELKSTTMLTPQACPDMIYYLPTPKSPHGIDVDPTGEYIVAGAKLSSTIPIHSFHKMLTAIQQKQFETESYGIPVLKYEAVLAGEVPNACLGPLHNEFDGKGNVYTTCFISSEIIKWKLGTWQIEDRMPVYYAPGHLMIPGGDSAHPWGKYLISINKMTKDRFLPTGPEMGQSADLIDISGDKMRMLLEFPTIGEPHYAQAIPASILMPHNVKYDPISQNHNPYATKSEQDVRVVREGNAVHVYMTAIRSHFNPDNIEGIHVGDTVYFHLTNLEQDWDVPHGFAVMGAANSDLLIMPGETRTLKWVPKQVGVFPFYCTDFCSALHQEMQGYVRVSPPGEKVALSWHGGGK
ncbi:MAG TPA: Sec-dependent nitrous-oxide reductase [Candidatus Acidoferrales bacterium]|nr:Sec-dependent nitrous-oxide reductase [Candidatus Acidoferrales bacterium]